jgi:lipopolysaccharide export LptBFGC system permease protein LptF
MRAPATINRYVFKEFFPPFGISLFFLTFVFLMTRIPEITNLVVNYNADYYSHVRDGGRAVDLHAHVRGK